MNQVKKKILIVGSGGREHALAWKCAQSPTVEHVFVAPGNGGTAQEKHVSNIPINAMDIPALISFAQQESIDLTIVGPEAPLAAGIVDSFTEHNLACFGPTKAAAQLEASKSFSKEFMQRHNIPTARFKIYKNAQEAHAYIADQSLPVVIKADGLAAGKGVILAHTHQEAHHAVDMMLVQKSFGNASNSIIIEEYLQGQELSFFVISDGQNFVPLATSLDHKRRDEGNEGPQTGGMGAYSPSPIITKELQKRIEQEVIVPTLKGMSQEATPFVGFLYAGLMIGPDGEIHVLEFNCRLGDPETQPVLMRLKNNSDFVDVCTKALQGNLEHVRLSWDPRTALTVVLTAGGYPLQYEKGDVIRTTHPTENDIKIFHGGTLLKNNHLYTNGGRVMSVTALGKNLQEAQEKVYQTIGHVSWRGMYYRADIGRQVR